MNKLAIIKKEDRNITFDVEAFLVNIKDREKYLWKLFWLEAFGGKQFVKGVSIDEINQSKDGLFLTWEELKAMIESFDQITEMVIVADQSQEKIESCTRKTTFDSQVEYRIELVDSSYFEVFTTGSNLKQFQKIDQVVISKMTEDEQAAYIERIS